MDNSPFVGSDAVKDGILTRSELRRDHTRIYRDVYLPRECTLDALTRARAAWMFSRGHAVVAGPSAAAIHGSRWIDADHTAELIWHEHRQPYSAIRIRADILAANELQVVDGIRVTTPARTAFDLGRRGKFARALEMVDALCNATGLSPAAVSVLAESHRGSRGIVQLRQVLEIADGGAESPQESRLRLLVLDSGLPRPTTQIEVRGSDGRVFARIDLGWERWKIAIEYDGEHHWSNPAQRAWDIERTYRLEQLGWIVIRVSALQLRRDPMGVMSRIRGALLAAGARI
ncbi:DUF559 domain-containing protein [Rhodococcoides kyotonense]|uniref:Restriction endonuclease type II-like domain-containing protein n=1 Tax=Rhodococcoides kyotonense TaxID=398843 RepID=A0A239EL14_9NOCA|nr:DUF559 domain-containing protein [Rhodococcus kyotonensis]SNS44602.1 Protein of unknown function [Rhodococcus kyotonensis]